MNETRDRMIGLGIERGDHAALQGLAGNTIEFLHWPYTKIPSPESIEREEPFLIWMPLSVWMRLPERRRQDLADMQGAEKALILPPDITREDLRKVVELGYPAINGAPLDEDAAARVMDRALEQRNIHSDIFTMTQDILLERELLERKNSQLSFVNRFLGTVAGTLSPGAIIERAREELSTVLPTVLLHGAFWPHVNGGFGPRSVELFLTDGLNQEAFARWIEALLNAVERVGGAKARTHTLSRIGGPNEDYEHLAPVEGQVLFLPVTNGGEPFGCVSLLSRSQYIFTRDRVDLLKGALNHLGLALHNAFLFRAMKAKADTDGLTGIYNRTHFDGRIREEIDRHRRVNEPLSLMLVDLDHFKQVNDSHGHQAGDDVLRRVSSVILESIRSTDYAARFGGEEFAVLLPHTSCEDGLILAERLRQAVADLRFETMGARYGVTASVGLATTTSGAPLEASEIIERADRALYRAKDGGRDQVRACVWNGGPEQMPRFGATMQA